LVTDDFAGTVSEHRKATDAEARALASTLRMRILRVCLSEARTNKEIAEALGRDPASTLHHVRRLVDTGFLTAQPARRGTRGAREKPYLATGKSWHLDMPARDHVLIDTFLEEVALVPPDEVIIARLGLMLTPEQKEELDQRMSALLMEYTGLGASSPPSAQAWSAFFAMHPDPNRP
jgi:hypothetical protein